MPLINWAEATADDLAGFTVDFLRNELLRRNLDVTGAKEDIIHRLLADIAQNRPPTPPALLLPDPATSAHCSQESLPLQTLDPAQSTQLLTSLLQQLLNMSQRPMAPVQITTLPDLSASLPTFSGDGGISARHWIEELERTQGLASWEPSTLLAVALGKLRGPAADWKVVTGRQCPTWDSFKIAFKTQFDDRLSLLQWQHKVTSQVQLRGESLVDYSLAKLKLISKCPVVLTDIQRTEYAIQGVQDGHLATSIAAQRPPTVATYMDIVTERDRTLSHSILRPSRAENSNAKPPVAKPYPASTQMIPADIPAIRKIDAFPDSGSKLTILSHNFVKSSSLLPWTKPPIAVVGGGTVVPSGTLCTRISVGPISAVVEVMVLERNPLPLILGEDWFEAAHAELLTQGYRVSVLREVIQDPERLPAASAAQARNRADQGQADQHDNTQVSGGSRVRSDLLGAKPKKPPRMTTTVKPESSASSTYSNASSSNKTFTRAPPFRNNPRLYSSTVLKDFNVTGKQGLAENASGDRGHLVMATPKRDSPPKEQRRPERRVRYKAEIVGYNFIVTRGEASPDKKQDSAFDCSKAFAIERQVSKVKEGESSRGISAAKEPPIPTSEVETAVLNHSLEADLKTGQGAEGLSPAKADAFTQLSDYFATDVGDKLVYPRQLTPAQSDILSPADSEDDGKFRSVSVQTRTSNTPSEM
ncbi:hypothetical protein HPB47_024368 [Ixodes persulcatus]|uniref:Uncharacterized protein n=1 Tax=Ixodes persulcatus TaxID=34615 RepID=A0AC60Q6K9_IXOPE|nr:hypothetical protein HPB47_024368 [Ixodes persulcatus]